MICWLNDHGRSSAKQREQDNLTVYKLTFECCLGSETDFLLCLVLFFSCSLANDVCPNQYLSVCITK